MTELCDWVFKIISTRVFDWNFGLIFVSNCVCSFWTSKCSSETVPLENSSVSSSQCTSFLHVLHKPDLKTNHGSRPNYTSFHFYHKKCNVPGGRATVYGLLFQKETLRRPQRGWSTVYGPPRRHIPPKTGTIHIVTIHPGPANRLTTHGPGIEGRPYCQLSHMSTACCTYC